MLKIPSWRGKDAVDGVLIYYILTKAEVFTSELTSQLIDAIKFNDDMDLFVAFDSFAGAMAPPSRRKRRDTKGESKEIPEGKKNGGRLCTPLFKRPRIGASRPPKISTRETPTSRRESVRQNKAKGQEKECLSTKHLNIFNDVAKND